MLQGCVGVLLCSLSVLDLFEEEYVLVIGFCTLGLGMTSCRKLVQAAGSLKQGLACRLQAEFGKMTACKGSC